MGVWLMSIPERLTLRLGSLRQPLEDHCQYTGENPSDVIRQAVAAMLGVEPPEMVSGNPEIASQAKAAAKARWRKARKKA